MAGELALSGENVPVTMFVDGKPVANELVMSLTVEENVTEHDDSYLGNDRDEPFNQVNSYTGSITVNVANSDLLAAFRKISEAKRARQTVPAVSLQFALESHDGTESSWVLIRLAVKWTFDASGRKDRAKVTVPFRARDCKPLAGVTV